MIGSQSVYILLLEALVKLAANSRQATAAYWLNKAATGLRSDMPRLTTSEQRKEARSNLARTAVQCLAGILANQPVDPETDDASWTQHQGRIRISNWLDRIGMGQAPIDQIYVVYGRGDDGRRSVRAVFSERKRAENFIDTVKEKSTWQLEEVHVDAEPMMVKKLTFTATIDIVAGEITVGKPSEQNWPAIGEQNTRHEIDGSTIVISTTMGEAHAIARAKEARKTWLTSTLSRLED